MPKVPTIDVSAPAGGASGRMLTDTPSVAASTGVSGFKTAAAPRPAQIGTTNPNIQGGDDQSGKIEARQLGAAADAVNAVGNTVQDIVMKMQQEANDTMVKSASIKMRQEALRLQYGSGDPNNPTDPNRVTGFTELKKADAVVPHDGKPMTAAYLEKFETSRQSIRESLKNDAQRRAFDAGSEEVRLNFETNAVKHTMDQYHVMRTDTADAAIKQSSEEMSIADPSDIDGYNAARTNLMTDVAERLAIEGSSPEVVKLAQQDALSKAGRLIVKKAIEEDNITRAQTYFEAYKADFTAQDRLEVSAEIKVHADATTYDAIGHDAVYGGSSASSGPVAAGTTPVVMGGTYDQMAAIAKDLGATGPELTRMRRQMQVESGGRASAQNGSSTGYFQFHEDTFRKLMPNGNIHSLKDQTTAALKLARQDEATLKKAGVPADDANIYIMHQQGGGGGKALLTAPREVGAVAALEPVAGRLALASIAGNIGLPYKTADQKAKANARAMQMSTGDFVDYWRTRWSEGAAGAARAPASRPQPAASLEEAVENARTTALRMGKDPEKAVAKAAQYYSIHDRTKTETESNSVNAAYAWLDAHGGDYNALPPSLKNAVPASQWDSLRSYGNNVSTGVGTKTDPATLQDLTNPDVLTAGTDAEFRAKYLGKLSTADFEQFSRERGGLLHPKPTAGNSPQDINRESFNDALHLGLAGMNIATTKSEKGYDAAKVGSLTKFAQDRLFAAQMHQNRKFSDAETTAFINDLFNKSVPFQRQLGGMTFGKMTEGKPGSMLMVDVKDIPPGERAAVVDRLKKNKIANPTDDQILYAWRVAHSN